MTMMLDQAGRQTPDMTGLARAKGNGKPRIYKMAEDMWVLEIRHRVGCYIKVLPSWYKCVIEFNVALNSYNRDRMLLNG